MRTILSSADKKWFFKILISLFIVFNFSMALRLNRTAPIVDAMDRYFRAELSEDWYERLKRTVWYLGWYPYLAGTDLMATMFSTIHRGHFEFRFVGRLEGEKEARYLFPIAGQSHRNIWQRYMTDAKEAKFHLNIYSKEDGKRRYSQYLCRKFPEYEGKKVVEVWQQKRTLQFLSRLTAQKTGKIHTEFTPWANEGMFSCRPRPRPDEMVGHL